MVHLVGLGSREGSRAVAAAASFHVIWKMESACLGTNARKEGCPTALCLFILIPNSMLVLSSWNLSAISFSFPTSNICNVLIGPQLNQLLHFSPYYPSLRGGLVGCSNQLLTLVGLQLLQETGGDVAVSNLLKHRTA